MGWFLDIYVGYALKAILRIFQTRGSGYWHLSTATVKSSDVRTGWFGCPTTEIVYTYDFEGRTYGGLSEKPFILPSSANRYASRFPPGNRLCLRLKPGNPEVSVMCEKDHAL
ncbi:MAG: DUF3592 domain-containing protein [Ktedonobacteraceae bacterium]